MIFHHITPPFIEELVLNPNSPLKLMNFQEILYAILSIVIVQKYSNLCKNTTEGINKLSYIFSSLYKNSIILTTRMEHHSNDLPWRDKFKVDYVELDELGKLNLSDLKYKLRKHEGKIKLVCVAAASNVTGYKNPIYKIAKIAHSFGAEILVDGAQAVPHYPIYMNRPLKEECIDYLAFSAHKMYSPFGIGVLIGPKNLLQCKS